LPTSEDSRSVRSSPTSTLATQSHNAPLPAVPRVAPLEQQGRHMPVLVGGHPAVPRPPVGSDRPTTRHGDVSAWWAVHNASENWPSGNHPLGET